MKNPYKSTPIKPSEITPYSQYLSRRAFLKAAAIFSGSALLGACAPKEDKPGSSTPVTSGQTDEFGDPSHRLALNFSSGGRQRPRSHIRVHSRRDQIAKDSDRRR